MKYIAVVNEKGELIAAQQIDEAMTSTEKPTVSPVSNSGQKLVEIDIPDIQMEAAKRSTEAAKRSTEAATNSPAEEIMRQLKGELQHMKR